jgi:hypothetical protein
MRYLNGYISCTKPDMCLAVVVLDDINGPTALPQYVARAMRFSAYIPVELITRVTHESHDASDSLSFKPISVYVSRSFSASRHLISILFVAKGHYNNRDSCQMTLKTQSNNAQSNRIPIVY